MIHTSEGVREAKDGVSHAEGIGLPLADLLTTNKSQPTISVEAIYFYARVQ